MDVKKILQRNYLTLSSFAEILNISRPTLNSYIRMYESNSSIPNEKFQIIFDELFKYKLSNEEFEKRLNKYQGLLKRDRAMGVLNLEADETDLFTTVLNNMKRDFYSGNQDDNVYIFINMLILNYKREEIFSHLIQYFMVLNNILPYEKINLKENQYLLQYFSVFEKDKKGIYEYDAELEKRFINRINEIKEIKSKSEKNTKNNLINMLNKEMNKFQDMGIELTEEELLQILLKKFKED